MFKVNNKDTRKTNTTNYEVVNLKAKILKVGNIKKQAIKDTACEKQKLTTSDQSGSIPLNHFSTVSYFYTPSKRQKTIGFLTFSGV